VIPSDASDKMCMGELRFQLTLVFLVLAAKNAIELFVPLILPRFLSWIGRVFDKSLVVPTIAANTEGQVKLSHVAQESLDRSPYGTMEVDGTLDDYLEIAILFGYIVLFSLVFPLAAVFGTALLLLELRVDGVKLYLVLRRPLPQNADSIGSWQEILNIMTWLSIATNAAMIIWTFGALQNRFPNASSPFMFFIMLVILVCLRVVIQFIVPDEPKQLKVLRAHQDWLKERIGQRDVDLPRDPNLTVESLHLRIHGAMEGQLREPEDFGARKSLVVSRVKRLERFQKKKAVFVEKRLTRTNSLGENGNKKKL